MRPSTPYSYGNIYRWEGTGLSLSDGDTVEVRLLRAFEDETAVNSAATGAPAISGTVQVGETIDGGHVRTSPMLTMGWTNATFAYQWLADDTEISRRDGQCHLHLWPKPTQARPSRYGCPSPTTEAMTETLTSAATDPVDCSAHSQQPVHGRTDHQRERPRWERC